LHGQYPAATLATVGAVKLLLVLVAFGTGVPGGLFAPTLFVGAMLGGTLGALAPWASPFEVSSPATFVLAGMGAFFAGVFRAPMTAIFMVFELSATYVAIVPAMIASSVAYLVARGLHHASLLDELGRDEGALLPSAQGQRESEPLRVEHAMRPAVVLEAATPVAVAREVAAASGAAHVIVRTHAGMWARVEPVSLSAPGGDGDTLADRYGSQRLLPLHPDEPLDAALRRLASQPVVPVVSRMDPARVLGMVTLEDVHHAYGLGPGGS
jgi:CIC family chloride channel protein